MPVEQGAPARNDCLLTFERGLRYEYRYDSWVMALRFSAHARQRMAERLIDEAEVAEALAGPTAASVLEDRPDRRSLTGTTPAGRVLTVVVAGADPVVVVTVFERRAAPRR